MSIILSIRNLIEDNSKFNASSPDTFEYISSKVFTLSEQNVNESSIICYKNGTLYDVSNYNFDLDTNKITISGSLMVGDILEFHYSYNSKYSEAEILGYISSALIYLSLEKYGDFILGSADVITPTPTVPEENLIALVASILIKKSIKSYKTNEVTIIFAEDMSIEKKIKLAIRQFRKVTGNIRYINTGSTIEEVD